LKSQKERFFLRRVYTLDEVGVLRSSFRNKYERYCRDGFAVKEAGDEGLGKRAGSRGREGGWTWKWCVSGGGRPSLALRGRSEERLLMRLGVKNIAVSITHTFGNKRCAGDFLKDRSRVLPQRIAEVRTEGAEKSESFPAGFGHSKHLKSDSTWRQGMRIRRARREDACPLRALMAA